MVKKISNFNLFKPRASTKPGIPVDEQLLNRLAEAAGQVARCIEAFGRKVDCHFSGARPFEAALKVMKDCLNHYGKFTEEQRLQVLRFFYEDIFAATHHYLESKKPYEKPNAFFSQGTYQLRQQFDAIRDELNRRGLTAAIVGLSKQDAAAREEQPVNSSTPKIR